ncbi:MAG: nucleotidyl transferase AbiEii/AbiGii toxin family protein [Lentisphaerae bacterium]|nr:nucleotidyl transferase AbiEii/AbiGii toxin family protein [Lentisphaerota bacterium]
MKEEAIHLAKNIADPAQRLNMLREYLQALVLRSLHESEAFQCIAFVGGTALRFLYRLPRFSEDLDFSLDSGKGYDPEKWVSKLKRDLQLAGLDIMISLNDRKTVHAVWIKIAGILKDAGLTGMAEQKLSIKLEVDTRPPHGAQTLNQVIERHRMFVVKCYDLPSLMAGKLHALITRGHCKGRDWYDFVWYRAQRPQPQPNLVLLQNALDQTEGKNTFEGGNWKGLVRDKLAKLDISKAREDVRPFLEEQREADLITRENLEALVRPVD